MSLLFGSISWAFSMTSMASFKCYWQIDQMIITRNFGSFPLVENVKIQVDDEEAKEGDDDLGGQNLKKEFRLPPVFFAPDFATE